MATYYKDGKMHLFQENIPIFVSKLDKNVWKVSFPSGQEPEMYRYRNYIVVNGKKRHVMKKIVEWWDEHSSKSCVLRTPIEWESWRAVSDSSNENWNKWQKRLSDDEAFQNWLRLRDSIPDENMPDETIASIYGGKT